MANYSKLDGYVFDKQSNIGWGLTLKMPSKAPAVAKRIFDTLAHAQEYIDDVKDTAIEGLVLSVVADTDTALNGAYFVKSVGKKSDVEGSENIKDVLVKLGSEDYTDTENKKNAKTYSIAKVEGAELSDLGTNVKEAYKLIDEDNVKAGSYIPVYKDSSLKSVELVSEKPAVGEEGQEGYVPSATGQFLKFTYLTTEGKDNVVYLDVSLFLAETEFKNGLSVNGNGEVSVKVDAASDGFLTVGADGVKLTGVQSAIDAIDGRLDVIEGEKTVEGSIKKALQDARYYAHTTVDSTIRKLNADVPSIGDERIKVTVKEVSGMVTAVTVLTSGITSTSALTDEINARTSADTALSNRLDVIEGEGEGSINKAIADIKGTITGDDAPQTLAALNNKINTVSYNISEEMSSLQNHIMDVILVDVTRLFTDGGELSGYDLSDLAKSNLYCIKNNAVNAVKFVGYGNSSTNPTNKEANLVMESFKDGIRTITIAHIKDVNPKLTTDSVKTYSSNAFIMKISQSDYDTMKNAGALDANTLYVIS